MSQTRIYSDVKIDSKGRILLPRELREYLNSKGVKKVHFEQDVETHQHFLRWSNPKQSHNHVERAIDFNEKFKKQF